MPTALLLALAVAAWLLGFGALRVTGSWAPLVLLALLLTAWVVTRDRRTRELLSFDVPAFLWGLALGAAMTVATHLLYPVAVRAVPGVAGQAYALFGLLFGVGLGPVRTGLVLVAMGFAEEVLWRGAALPPWARPYGALLPVTGSAVLYAAATAASGSWLLTVAALCCALAWGAARVLTGSLWTAVVAHAAWDLGVLLVFPLQ